MRVLSDGRIRRTEEEWRVLVSGFASSGVSEVQYCRRQKISRNAFRNWKRRLASAAAEPGFVEWKAPALAAEATSESALVSGEFEVSLPGGVRVRWKP